MGHSLIETQSRYSHIIEDARLSPLEPMADAIYEERAELAESDAQQRDVRQGTRALPVVDPGYEDPHPTKRLAARLAGKLHRAKPLSEQSTGGLADPLGLRGPRLFPRREPCHFHHRQDHQRRP